jgi:hypothetical protein
VQREGIDLAHLVLLVAERERWYRLELAIVQHVQDTVNVASIRSNLGVLLIEHREQRQEGC